MTGNRIAAPKVRTKEQTKAYWQGYNAREAGKPWNSNPYSGFLYRNEPPDNWSAWNEGWITCDLVWSGQ